MENLLYPLSNPTSEAIRRRLVRSRFFVGVEEGGEENHIQMNLKGQLGKLNRGQMYI